MKTYNVIGIMSGTSLDGLDVAYCKFIYDKKWSYQLLHAETMGYSGVWKKKLAKAVELNSFDLLLLDRELGLLIGKYIRQFIDKYSLDVDFISSHGHTVFHQPEKGITFQIGSGYHIAIEAGMQVVCDFRSLDVALGGHGAPLVPIGDKLLFGDYSFCLNLGGIANISFSDESGTHIAYDIAPANMLLNYLCKERGKEYDNGGEMAGKGVIDKRLLSKMNNLKYYQKNYPKSLGWEWFETYMIPLLQESKNSTEDKLRTAVEHINLQICRDILTTQTNGTLLITGGGALNTFLIEDLKEKVKDYIEVVIPDEKTINYKEAVIFALLGILKLQNKPNCIKSVTGAQHDNTGGVIYTP